MFLKSLFGDDMTLYTENPKDATRKLLDLINKYSNVIGYTNNQKLVINQKKDKLRKHLPLQQKE